MNKTTFCANLLAALAMLTLAAPASAAVTRFDPIMLDLNRDGLDLSGSVDTDQFEYPISGLHWTKKNSDDAFVLVDADALRTAGEGDVKDSAGVALHGSVQFRDGIRIRVPGESSDRIITDGWQMLAAFDKNNDGRINASDPVWGRLKLYNDSNGDGTIGASELRTLDSAQVLSIFESASIPPFTDAYGNEFRMGGFESNIGGGGQAANVSLTSVPEPSTLAAAGIGLVLLGLRWAGQRRSSAR